MKGGGFALWQWALAVLLFPVGFLSFLAGRRPPACPSCGETSQEVS